MGGVGVGSLGLGRRKGGVGVGVLGWGRRGEG